MHILCGRPARTINGQAPAETLNMQDIREKLIHHQEKSAAHYNKRHRAVELPPLHERENVLIQH